MSVIFWIAMLLLALVACGLLMFVLPTHKDHLS